MLFFLFGYVYWLFVCLFNVYILSVMANQYSLRITSLNVKNLCHLIKMSQILYYLHKCKVCVCFIQEAHIDDTILAHMT